MGCEPELLKTKTKPAKTRKLDLPEGVPPLTSLYMYISGSCNLACRHCWIEPDYQINNRNGKFLKLEYLKKAIAEAKPLGLQSVKLTGGEPTIHPQFRELVSLIENEKLNITMETNGILIDEDLAGFLKDKHHFSFVSVSLDGVKPETHDLLRGVSGSYQQALTGIKNLITVGFRPQVICTLHQGNVSEMTNLIDMVETLGGGSIKFNLVQQIGRGEGFSKNHGLSIEEIIRLYSFLQSDIIPQKKIPIFFDIPHAFSPIRNLLKGSLGRCAILNVIGLLPGGELALCGIGTTISELIYGHIGTDDLAKIWLENPKLTQLREQIPGQLDGICSDCIHRDVCLGTCVANNFHGAGKLNAAYFFCKQAEVLSLFPESRKKINIQ